MKSRKLGQHFLADKSIAKIFVKYANLSKDDIVLEIGSGKGIITKEIQKICKVIAIEKDKTLILESNKNLELIYADALKINFPRFTKIISNLPFSISSPIIFKLLDYKFKIAILGLQKEFAQRMISFPGTKEFSRLSLMTQYHAEPKILEIIPKSKFKPVPDVDAAIVQLIPKNAPKIEKELQNFITQLFRQKKKTLQATLKILPNLYFQCQERSDATLKILKLDKSKIPQELLEKRIFQLSFEEIKEIYRSIML